MRVRKVVPAIFICSLFFLDVAYGQQIGQSINAIPSDNSADNSNKKTTKQNGIAINLLMGMPDVVALGVGPSLFDSRLRIMASGSFIPSAVGYGFSIQLSPFSGNRKFQPYILGKYSSMHYRGWDRLPDDGSKESDMFRGGGIGLRFYGLFFTEITAGGSNRRNYVSCSYHSDPTCTLTNRYKTRAISVIVGIGGIVQ